MQRPWRLPAFALTLALAAAAATGLHDRPRPEDVGDEARTFAAVGDLPADGVAPVGLEEMIRAIGRARDAGASYVVLPEPGTDPGSPGEPVPGPTTDHLGDAARRLGVWVAASVLERDPASGRRYLTSVLCDDTGTLAAKVRKVIVRDGREDGPAERGSYRDVLNTVDDRGLRLGILSGDDVRAGVPRLANLGADVVFVTAGWGGSEPVDWQGLCGSLAREHRVHLVVANRRRPGAGGGAAAPVGGVFDRDGRFVGPAPGEGLAVAALTRRLVAWRTPSALGLPATVPTPASHPASPELAELGRRLFFDTDLSRTGKVSCATCHQPARGFTNGLPTGVGVDGRKTRRNVPSLLNVGFRPLLRWDGYASTIENFVKYPFSGVNEMDFHYLDKVEPYLRSHPAYAVRFRAVIGDRPLSFDDVAAALAAYQRGLVSGGSPFDRYAYGEDHSALGDAARRGLALFRGKARCAGCHPLGPRHALFTDYRFHDLGVGYDPARDAYDDTGLGDISTDDLAGYFQTPPLRDVALTAPYMHDGSLPTLEAVVDFFDRGGNPTRRGDSGLVPLDLSRRERDDLVAFLGSLTGAPGYSDDGRPAPRTDPPDSRRTSHARR